MKNTRPQQEKKQRVVPFIIISLLVHSVLFISLVVHQKYFEDSDLAKAKVEPTVQFLDLAQSGLLVDMDDKQKPTEKPKDAKYRSALDRTVKKETRAVNHGDFQNLNSKETANTVSQETSQAKMQQAKQAPVEAPSADNMKTFKGGDMFVPTKKKEQKATTVSDLRPNTMNALSEDAMATVSQTPDYLKDVAAGAETNLNTTEFIYYSYFNRIRKDLRSRWEPLIHQKVQDIVRKGQQRNLASNETKLTNVIFTLNERGVITRIQVKTTSGVTDLDDAAIEALQAIGQFPHPPKDLVVNGIVQIPWTFILES